MKIFRIYQKKHTNSSKTSIFYSPYERLELNQNFPYFRTLPKLRNRCSLCFTIKNYGHALWFTRSVDLWIRGETRGSTRNSLCKFRFNFLHHLLRQFHNSIKFQETWWWDRLTKHKLKMDSLDKFMLGILKHNLFILIFFIKMEHSWYKKINKNN